MSGIKVDWEARYKSYKVERTRELVDKLGDGMAKAAFIVERQAKINVSKPKGAHPRVDTGRLRASITSQTKKEGDKIVGGVGTNVEYGADLEYGTSRHPAYPWLFPAFESSKDKIKEALSKG